MSARGMGINPNAVQCEHMGCSKWARERIAEGEPRNQMKPPGEGGWMTRGTGPAPAHLCCTRRHCQSWRK